MEREAVLNQYFDDIDVLDEFSEIKKGLEQINDKPLL
jgi:hypothetical protein